MPDILIAEGLVDGVAAAEPVRTLVRGPAVTVEQHDSLRDVAGELARGEVDAALVVGPTGEVGIVTARDVVVGVAAGGAADGEQVRGVMSAKLVAVAADDPIAAVGRTMFAAGVRHVVVRDGGRVVGIVSVDDLFDALLA